METCLTNPPAIESLTNNELVKLFADGQTLKQVAMKYGASIRMVDYRLQALRERHGAINTTHLVAIFLRIKLIE